KYLVLFQHLLEVFLVVAVTAATWQVSGSRRQALIAGILLAIDLPTLGNSNLVLTETLFTAALAATLWLLWRGSRQPEQGWTSFVLPGLTAGMATLIRPIGLYFFIPVTVYLFSTTSRSRLRAVAGFIAGFACLPLLWAGRNYRETGHFAVAS